MYIPKKFGKNLDRPNFGGGTYGKRSNEKYNCFKRFAI